MYDKNQIEDSLEFCRQIKTYYGEEQSVQKSVKSGEPTAEELFADMAQKMEKTKRPWESVLQEDHTAGIRSDSEVMSSVAEAKRLEEEQAAAEMKRQVEERAAIEERRQAREKLSREEIDDIFEREVEKSRKETYGKRKDILRQEALEQKARRKKEKENRRSAQEKQGVLESIGEWKEDFLLKLENRKSVNEMIASDSTGDQRQNRILHLVSNLLVVGMCIFIAYFLASLVTNYVAHPTSVEGESMEPTLTDGDSVIIQKMSYYFGDPDRYDVVVFPVSYDAATKQETYYIKRVIGLPGETVQISEGKVLINGSELIDDHYALTDIMDPGEASEPITLASDEYFVLGDNRNMSTDSRSSYVGLVKRRNIIGEAWFCVWPFSHFGTLTD